ncbi:hypothetical protein [Coleofasciculus chthonoplastes]|uniref:hypothetical protein n=1 Tax=Coleofasciculus chthonoplastes TaxID=64178 RepID=UPI0032F0F713
MTDSTLDCNLVLALGRIIAIDILRKRLCDRASVRAHVGATLRDCSIFILMSAIARVF